MKHNHDSLFPRCTQDTRQGGPQFSDTSRFEIAKPSHGRRPMPGPLSVSGAPEYIVTADCEREAALGDRGCSLHRRAGVRRQSCRCAGARRVETALANTACANMDSRLAASPGQIRGRLPRSDRPPSAAFTGRRPVKRQSLRYGFQTVRVRNFQTARQNPLRSFSGNLSKAHPSDSHEVH
jgi:hypothetical protein